MGAIKNLAKDTAVYGISSIVGRFLNWCLVPMYTRLFTEATYGVVTLVYSISAVALIILIYGMETGYFRFANHDWWKDSDLVYGTSMISLSVSSSVFLIGTLLCLEPLTGLLHCGGHTSYVAMMLVTLALDAFTAVPFCRLRYLHRPVRFAGIKLAGIALNIGFNLFFLLVCPWLSRTAPALTAGWYDPDFGIGYIFLSNLISSGVTALLLLPELTCVRWRFDSRLWREMLSYSWPLLVLGVAGILNQTIDKILLPVLVADPARAMVEVGIYGANYKIAIVMVMFIQAYRFAFEPFIFAQNKDRGGAKLHNYALAMKYFVIFSMVIFLGVMFYIDIVRLLIAPEYYPGLKVVPVVMVAEFFFGVYFNLSLWYKLTDRTGWGTLFTLLGLAVVLLLNALLVPRMGYMGCAWASLGCYGVMMLTNWIIGQRKYPIPYQTGRLCAYFAGALALYGLAVVTTTGREWLDMGIRTVYLVIYVAIACRAEHFNLKALLPRGAASTHNTNPQS